MKTGTTQGLYNRCFMDAIIMKYRLNGSNYPYSLEEIKDEAAKLFEEQINYKRKERHDEYHI